MCIVSMIGDDFYRRHRDSWPTYPWESPHPSDAEKAVKESFRDAVQSAQIAELKKEIEALKELIKAAKKYDEVTGQPDCEHGDKVKLIKDIARALDVDLEDLLD